MEKIQCGECQLEIMDTEPLRCGLCEHYFHFSIECSGFGLSRTISDLFSKGNALFVCSGCRNKMNGRGVKSFLADEIATDPSPPSEDLTAQVQQLFQLVKSLSDKVDKCISTDTPAARPPLRPKKDITWPKLGVKRRRGDEGEPIGISSVRGTKTVDLSDLSVPCLTPQTAAPKFWLYLSGLHPLIADGDIQ